MKNTEICSGEYIKSEVQYRKILRQIDLLVYQISEVKKMVNIFWDIRLNKPDQANWLSRGDDLWWKTATYDILERWKEIHENKDEIDWALRNMFVLVEQEEKQRQEKQRKTTIEGC